jgi:superoxide dismutase, Fe-Mn family
MKKTSRRKFITNSAAIGMGSVLAVPAFGHLLPGNHSPENFANLNDTSFDQTPLGYVYNALEPSIDATTMDIHYNKHAAAYSKNLKDAAAAEGVDAKSAVEKVLGNISKYSVKMRNNAGGHYNHELFWKTLTATDKSGQPAEKLLTAINSSFGSLDEFKKQFSEAAKSRFGSGWAWLIVGKDKKLIISSTANQDSPLMDIAEVKGFPLFGLDVWEHAYYLKYQNRRAEYIDNFWKVLNWNFVSERFNSI